MCSLFGNTGVCGHLLGRINHTKSQLRSKITDEHLENALRVVATSVEIDLVAHCFVKR